MNVFIERCRADLADQFWQCLDAVARERRYLIFLEGPPIESTREFVGKIIKNGWTQYYAVHEDQVIGWCDVIPNTREGTRHAGQLGMGVRADFRGQGIGRRLLSTVLDDAWSKGLTRVDLVVFAANTRAIALYRSMGFVEEGRMRRAWCLDGICDDMVKMAILRDPDGNQHE